MRAGELTRTIKIYKRQKLESAFSTKGETKLVEVLKTKARRMYKSAGLNLEAMELSDSSVYIFSFHKFVLPYLSLDAVLEDAGERFRVLSIEDNQRYRCINAICERLNE